MPTAAERAAAAEAKRAAKAADMGAYQGDAVAPSASAAVVDPDADLYDMTLPEVRTEAKRLMGADFDHSVANDRDALIDMARAGRSERRAYYAGQRTAQVDAAKAVIRGADAID